MASRKRIGCPHCGQWRTSLECVPPARVISRVPAITNSIIDPAPSKTKGATSQCRGIVVDHHWERRSLYIGVRWESGIVSHDAPGTLKVIGDQHETTL